MVEKPSYEQVCSGSTGHAEAVEIEFDPEQITYEQLLEEFWQMHDPTQLNRQGPDKGTQYRSAIFYHDEAQHEAAEASKQQLATSERFKQPIATTIEAAAAFYPAEGYHQQYLEKRGLSTCTPELAS